MPAPRRRRAAATLAALALALAPAAALAQAVTVFAAASLAGALDDALEGWGGEARIAYAGSSALARQIEAGAPADVFISANTAWMDALEAGGLIDPATRADLLSNRIALVAHGDAPPVEIGPALDLPALLGDGRLAMALVDAVPAGIYGRAALQSLGLWDAVAPRVAQADNVRAALALVATGAAPLGVVYATDAAASDRVTVLGLFPEDTHPPIRYPAAAVAGGDAEAAAALLARLRGPEARAAFLAAGFAMAEDAPR